MSFKVKNQKKYILQKLLIVGIKNEEIKKKSLANRFTRLGAAMLPTSHCT